MTYIQTQMHEANVGFAIQASFMTSPIYWDPAHSVEAHLSILRHSHSLLQFKVLQEGLSINTPFNDIRELQMNFQYTGKGWVLVFCVECVFTQ